MFGVHFAPAVTPVLISDQEFYCLPGHGFVDLFAVSPAAKE